MPGRRLWPERPPCPHPRPWLPAARPEPVRLPARSPSSPSVLRRKWFDVKLLDLGFGRGVIVVGPIETNAAGRPRIVDVGAQHVPALAQVQHAVMTLRRPALGCYPN